MTQLKFETMEEIDSVELVSNEVTEKEFEELICHKCGDRTQVMYANLPQNIYSCMRCLPSSDMLQAMVKNNKTLIQVKPKNQK